MSALWVPAQLPLPGPATTPGVDWGDLSPFVILGVGALALLLIPLIGERRTPGWLSPLVAVATSAATVVAAVAVWRDTGRNGPRLALADAVAIDRFTMYFAVLLAAVVAASSVVAHGYARRERLRGLEIDVLLLTAAVGGLVMAAANDLIVLFVGLETISIAAYVLAGYHRRRLTSQEAAVKYFVLGAFSSALFLYGIALVYGATGSTNLSTIGEFLTDNVRTTTAGLVPASGALSGELAFDGGVLAAGLALLLVGFGFKVAAVPFHTWTPDVYQGAPSPVTGFFAAAVKAAAFAGMLRTFGLTFDVLAPEIRPVLGALIVATLAVGSVLAIVQDDVKRMLAYSSVAHAGYILLGVYAADATGIPAALVYLGAYAVLVVGSFAVVSVVGRTGDADHRLPVYRGLARRRPVLAVAFAVLLLAQAGVPFTVGFLAKFEVIRAAVDVGAYWLAVVAMVAAVVAAYLYLRITVVMFMADDEPEPSAGRLRVPAGAAVVIGVALVAAVVVGIFPQPLLDVARDAAAVVAAPPGL